MEEAMPTTVRMTPVPARIVYPASSPTPPMSPAVRTPRKPPPVPQPYTAAATKATVAAPKYSFDAVVTIDPYLVTRTAYQMTP
jgi:hypothetical protein